MPAPLESWISIGGLTLHFSARDLRLATPPEGAITAFLGGPMPADLDVEAVWADTLADPDGLPLFESGGAWRAARTADGLCFTCRSPLRGAEPYAMATVDAAFSRAVVAMNARYWPGAAPPPFPLDYPLDELLLVHLLAGGRGLEVHGCGVLDAAGRAYIFAGQSGSGKSTIARWWTERPGVTVLSDERVVVRTDGNGVIVYGTPWHGDAEIASPRSGPLAGVFFLKQNRAHGLERVGRSRAAAALLSCAFMPFYDRAAVERSVASAERIVAASAPAVLAFANDRSVVDYVAANTPGFAR